MQNIELTLFPYDGTNIRDNLVTVRLSLDKFVIFAKKYNADFVKNEELFKLHILKDVLVCVPEYFTTPQLAAEAILNSCLTS